MKKVGRERHAHRAIDGRVINECVAITRANWNSCDLAPPAQTSSTVRSVGDVISPVYVAYVVSTVHRVED